MSDREPVTSSPSGDAPEPAAAASEPVGRVAASTGGTVDLDRVLGVIPVVLVFLEPHDDPPAHEVIRSLGSHLVDFGRDRIQLLAVARGPVSEVVQLDRATAGHVRILADDDGALADRFGAEYCAGRPVTVLVDRTGAVHDRWVDRPGASFAEELLDRIAALGG